MIALVFALCLVVYAICFWLAFGELERPPGAISTKSSGSRVGFDKAAYNETARRHK